MDPVRITHFSDTLCVWAYVSQTRCDHLASTFEERIELDYRYVHVFGNVTSKLAAWADRGGQRGYADHVRDIVEGFDHVELHADVWMRDVPASSMPSHLFLCGVRILEERGEAPNGAAERAAWSVRRAFFAECADVSRTSVLRKLAESDGLPVDRLTACLENGEAHATLAADLDLARDQIIRASPTMVFNQGRQKLTGNVGYRIIEANIRELLEGGAVGAHSWC